MIDSLPGIVVAQTKTANTLVRWAQSDYKTYAPGLFQDTVASAMNIQDPVSFPRIKKLYKNFNMFFFDTAEDEISRVRTRFSRAGGNICPQTAVALDAVLQAKAKNIIKENDIVVTIGTASGLKFTETGIRHHLSGKEQDFANPPRVIKGTIEEIEKAVKF